MTENAPSGNAFADDGPPSPRDSALRPAGSDLHPADAADDLTTTAEYGRESAAARADTSDDTPTPRATPAD